MVLPEKFRKRILHEFHDDPLEVIEPKRLHAKPLDEVFFGRGSTMTWVDTLKAVTPVL